METEIRNNKMRGKKKKRKVAICRTSSNDPWSTGVNLHSTNIKSGNNVHTVHSGVSLNLVIELKISRSSTLLRNLFLRPRRETVKERERERQREETEIKWNKKYTSLCQNFGCKVIGKRKNIRGKTCTNPLLVIDRKSNVYYYSRSLTGEQGNDEDQKQTAIKATVSQPFPAEVEESYISH